MLRTHSTCTSNFVMLLMESIPFIYFYFIMYKHHKSLTALLTECLIYVFGDCIVQTSLSAQLLNKQLSESQITVQTQALQILDRDDRINDKAGECGALTAQLNVIQIEYLSESSSLNECRSKLEKTSSLLHTSNMNLSDVTSSFEKEMSQNEMLRCQLDSLGEQLSESKDLLVQSTDQVDEWRDRYKSAESDFRQEMEEWKETERELKEELEENRVRGDSAEGELQKHRDLMSYINKLSAEGEAGRAKARRLSAAITGAGTGVGTLDVSGCEVSNVSDTSPTGERSRKLRKPSSK